MWSFIQHPVHAVLYLPSARYHRADPGSVSSHRLQTGSQTEKLGMAEPRAVAMRASGEGWVGLWRGEEGGTRCLILQWFVLTLLWFLALLFQASLEVL